MPYDNPGNSGGDMGEGEAMNPRVHIPSDMFPGKMASGLKGGEVIEFRVVGPPDDEGDVEIEYNFADEGKPNVPPKGEEMEHDESMHEDGEGDEDWAAMARKELGPQQPENSAY